MILALGAVVVIYFHLLCSGLFLGYFSLAFHSLFLQVDCSSVMHTQNVWCQYRSYDVNKMKQNCMDANKKKD